LVFKFFNLYRYALDNPKESVFGDEVGLCKLNPADP
jgi:hypothetical protein